MPKQIRTVPDIQVNGFRSMLDTVESELKETSDALEKGWRPPTPSEEQNAKTEGMKRLIAGRRKDELPEQ